MKEDPPPYVHCAHSRPSETWHTAPVVLAPTPSFAFLSLSKTHQDSFVSLGMYVSLSPETALLWSPHTDNHRLWKCKQL